MKNKSYKRKMCWMAIGTWVECNGTQIWHPFLANGANTMGFKGGFGDGKLVLDTFCLSSDSTVSSTHGGRSTILEVYYPINLCLVCAQ
jgi:hypothetical protein